MISSTTKAMEMLYSCKWNLPEASTYCGLSWNETKEQFKNYLTMKIDTQGMSYGTSETSTKSLEEQRAAIPPFDPPKIPLITDMLKKELKELINEVLDEREHEKKLNGPYDFPEL